MKKNVKNDSLLADMGHLQTDLIWSAECGLGTPLLSCMTSKSVADTRAYVL